MVVEFFSEGKSKCFLLALLKILAMRDFRISLVYKQRIYGYLVRYGKRTIGYQYFHVVGRNREIILQTNLPMLERRNITTRPLFELADGSSIKDKVFFDLITDKIWEKIEEGRKK